MRDRTTEMIALKQINSELCGVIDDMEREKRVLELERDRIVKRRSRERGFWYTFWLAWLFLYIVFML